ncbi:MAG: hypothetical protein Q9190_002446 [Brigantiaea leucoxantha]
MPSRGARGRQKQRVLSKPRYQGPIPRCKGPKLSPFRDRKAAIEFVRLLSDPELEGQAYVFEVSIASKPYALKVFKFYDDAEDDFCLGPWDRDKVSLDLLHAHMDPFYNECRAYGRLIEKGLNGDVAVRCHGYITLPPERETELVQRFGVSELDRPWHVGERQVLRAIVKDLVREDVPLTHKVVKKMFSDLKRMRAEGVYNMDVRARNYKGGMLLDLSIAITTPHYLFEINAHWRVTNYKLQDLLQFDQMIKDEKIATWVRARPNKAYLAKLRPRPTDRGSDYSSSCAW